MTNNDIKTVSKWLVKINFFVPVLIGIAAAALVAINYEWLIIIEFLVGVVVFTLAFIISAILWKYTVGYLLAFGVGFWLGHTRHDD